MVDLQQAKEDEEKQAAIAHAAMDEAKGAATQSAHTEAEAVIRADQLSEGLCEARHAKVVLELRVKDLTKQAENHKSVEDVLRERLAEVQRVEADALAERYRITRVEKDNASLRSVRENDLATNRIRIVKLEAALAEKDSVVKQKMEVEQHLQSAEEGAVKLTEAINGSRR